jgi:hypothetical protein
VLRAMLERFIAAPPSGTARSTAGPTPMCGVDALAERVREDGVQRGN